MIKLKQLRGSKIVSELRPIVYAWKRGRKWLYVGCSRLGIGRIFTHNVITLNRIELTDRIYIWYFQDHSKALEYEAELIHQYRPHYNIIHTYHRRKNTSYRGRQFKSKLDQLDPRIAGFKRS